MKYPLDFRVEWNFIWIGHDLFPNSFAFLGAERLSMPGRAVTIAPQV